MPRKRTPPQTQRTCDTELPDVAATAASANWLPVVVAVLVTARFFLPAESAAQGETLWIVLLWLICGVLWLFTLYRNESPLPRPDWLTFGIMAVVVGHVVSAVSVLLTEGDSRAALNMLWEWVGIGVAAVLIRQVMKHIVSREGLLSLIVVSGVVLSGLGLWQHYYWYPSISAQLVELEELQTASPDDLSPASRVRRMEALRRELGWTPSTDDASAQMFRDRVQASTEPIGRFALANTFAGLLLVAMFLALGGLRAALNHGLSVLKWSGFLGSLVLIAYCLWLTKSRTAWAGVIGGMATVAFLGRGNRNWLPGNRWIIAGVAAVVIGMPALAALSGSLDREVLSEAPKSLQYRMEYWQATGRMIADHWMLGVGPGNFRQQYLKYKLPGSSEEILDPHNLVLDVWANGGVLALAGLVAILGYVLWCSRSAAISEPVPKDGSHVLSTGGIGTAAMVLAAFCEMLAGTFAGGHWLWLVGGWWIAVWSLRGGLNSQLGNAYPLAALGALVIHLMGAGGIAMPAITQVLLILAIAIVDAVRIPASDSVKEEREGESPAEPLSAKNSQASRSGNDLAVKLTPVLLVAGVAMVIACALTATLPVTKATASMNIGRSLWLAERQPLAAERLFLQAAEDDPLSPEPWQELAGVRFARWMQTGDDPDFQRAVDAQRESIARDPLNAGRWRSLGQLWMRRYERESSQQAAEAAFAAYLEAVQRYPHSAAAQAELATAAGLAGETAQARAAAQAAIQLDEINRSRGHIDKYLTEEQLSDLRNLAEGDTGHSAE